MCIRDSLSTHELIIAGSQADLIGTASHVDGPVGAGVALDRAVIAQSAQQHLQEGKAGQGAGGTEGAVGVAVDQPPLHTKGDVCLLYTSKSCGGGMWKN